MIKYGLNNAELITVFLVFLFDCNPTLSRIDIMQYGLYALLLLQLVLRGRVVRLDTYLKYFIIFLMYCIGSCLWSIDLQESISCIFALMKELCILVFLSTRKFERENTLFAFSMANFLNSLIVYPNIDLAALFSRGARQDPIVGGIVWDTTTICSMFAISVVFLMFIAYKTHSKQKRAVCFIMCIPQLATILLLGSRQALLMMVAAIVVFVLKANKLSGKKVAIMFGLLVVLGIGMYTVQTNETLYRTIGSRLSGGATETDSSRAFLIQYGLQMFVESPIWGYGIGGFKETYSWIAGRRMYAHNNYVEILVGLGIMGFIIYYSIIPMVFYKTIKNRTLDREDKGLIYALIVIFLISGMVIPTYFALRYQLLTWVAWQCAIKKETTIT